MLKLNSQKWEFVKHHSIVEQLDSGVKTYKNNIFVFCVDSKVKRFQMIKWVYEHDSQLQDTYEDNTNCTVWSLLL